MPQFQHQSQGAARASSHTVNTDRTATSEQQQALDRVASSHGISKAAVDELWRAVRAGRGAMAQFRHPELGGSGQWMRGGMTMVGDMFNHDLRAKVHAVCSDLADLLSSMPPEGNEDAQASAEGASTRARWPSTWGTPSTAGAQNHVEYAWFPLPRRLWLRRAGRTSVYDTDVHQIHGVAQQQGGRDSLTFTSQLGEVSLDSLRRIDDADAGARAAAQDESRLCVAAVDRDVPAPRSSAAPVFAPVPSSSASLARTSSEEILQILARLAELQQAGVITEEEFTAKKKDLLARL